MPRITKEPAERRQEIIDTAMKLFYEKGYEKTSITDIAREMGGVLLFLLSVGVVGFVRPLSGLFLRSEDVAGIVAGYFLIIGAGYVQNTVTNCFLGALNGLGRPFKSMMLMVFYYILVRMPLAWLPNYAGWGAWRNLDGSADQPYRGMCSGILCGIQRNMQIYYVLNSKGCAIWPFVL